MFSDVQTHVKHQGISRPAVQQHQPQVCGTLCPNLGPPKICTFSVNQFSVIRTTIRDNQLKKNFIWLTVLEALVPGCWASHFGPEVRSLSRQSKAAHLMTRKQKRGGERAGSHGLLVEASHWALPPKGSTTTQQCLQYMGLWDTFCLPGIIFLSALALCPVIPGYCQLWH